MVWFTLSLQMLMLLITPPVYAKGPAPFVSQATLANIAVHDEYYLFHDQASVSQQSLWNHSHPDLVQARYRHQGLIVIEKPSKPPLTTVPTQLAYDNIWGRD